MPSFLCCSTSTKSLPISPDGASSASRSLLAKKGLDASPDGSSAAHIDDMGQRPRQKDKLHVLLNETLLPGQLPENGRGAARVQIVEPEKKRGVPLLEDTLSDSKSSVSRLGFSFGGSLGLPVLASELDIPAQLLATTSSSFEADYRDGEMVTSPTSASDSLQHLSGASTVVSDTPVAPRERTVRVDELECLRQVLQAPLRRALSHASGQWRLYKQCSHGAAAQLSGAVAAAHASGTGFASLTSTNLEANAARKAAEEQRLRIETPGEPPPKPHASTALYHLQRELQLATELPCCPLLLLPRRVYKQTSTVHVVYDCAGQFSELYALLQERQRFSERSCQCIFRQLLQAVAALHENHWVHRNISSETVWVAEPLRDAGLPSAPSVPPLPLHPQPAAAAAVAEGTNSDASAVALIATLEEESGSRRATTSGAPKEPPAPVAPGSLASAAGPLAAGHSAVDGEGGQGRRVAAGQNQQAGPGPGQEPAVGQALQPRPPRFVVKLGGFVHAARERPEAAGSGAGCQFRELLGSPYHLAPEAVAGKGYGRAADVWAAGVLLYMMLTGRPPFPGRNELEVMTRLLLTAAETEATQPSPSPAAATAAAAVPPVGPRGTGDRIGNPGLSGPGWMTASRKAAACPGTSDKSLCTVSSVGTEARPRHKMAETIQEVVLQAVLESCASVACREALAAMLELDPARRLGAVDLLKLPWFANGDE